MSIGLSTDGLILVFALKSGTIFKRVEGGFASWKAKGTGQGEGKPRSPHSSTNQPLIVAPAFYLPSFQPFTPLTLHPSGVDRYCQVRRAGSEKSRSHG